MGHQKATADSRMDNKQNTVVCCFDCRSPRITVFHIHEWIYEKLHLDEDDIRTIQIDGMKQVFIKFTNSTRLYSVLTETKGQLEFKHDNGELSQVTTELARMGMRKIRIANLPPEVNDRMIKDILVKYGEVREIKEKQWTRTYRNEVSNGIRIVDMNLKQHLASHLTTAGNRVLVSYEGQPATCYGAPVPRLPTKKCCALRYRLAAINMGGYSLPTQQTHTYTGCSGGNVPDFGRMFLKLKYTDKTKNISEIERLQRSWREKFESMRALTHLLITKYILKLAEICCFCNINICT